MSKVNISTELLTVDETAQAVGVSSATIRRWVNEEGLPVLRAGSRGTVRIDPGELRAYLERGRYQ